MSVCKPHTSEIRAAHPYLKNSWVPPESSPVSLGVAFTEIMMSFGSKLSFMLNSETMKAIDEDTYDVNNRQFTGSKILILALI